jgi:lipoprotein-anchoring transpeptidase ErfK/SrfK
MLEQLQRRKAQAEQRKAVEQQQSSAQILNTVITAGAGILGAFMGRKTLSVSTINKATTAVRAASRAAKEYGDVGRADETVQAAEQQLQELNAQFEAEVAALDSKVDPTTEVFKTVTIRPKKTGISIQLVALGWKPQ